MVVYVETVQEWYVSTEDSVIQIPGDKTFAEFVQDRHFFSSVMALHCAWLSIIILLYTTMDKMIYKEKCVMKLSKLMDSKIYVCFQKFDIELF